MLNFSMLFIFGYNMETCLEPKTNFRLNESDKFWVYLNFERL